MRASLSLTPNHFGAVEWEPWASMGMRKAPVDNYLVFYLAEDVAVTVTVVRIFYVGKNVENIIKSDFEE